MKSQSRNKLIVALDVPTASSARDLIALLKDDVEFFKVGSQLFTATGPDLVREIVRLGNQVFLDLKFHDIPNTVAAAAVEAARLGVSILNVHAAGGREMMRRTAEAVSEAVEREGLLHPSVIAVTVLTSVDEATLRVTGINNSAEDQVIKLGVLAAESGMDGVVASALEIRALRAAISKPNFLIVTPGVRPANSERADQRRVMTPGEALAAGADYLVVGRPITAAKDPLTATQAILAEIAAVSDNSRGANQEL